MENIRKLVAVRNYTPNNNLAINASFIMYPCNYHPRIGVETYGSVVDFSFQEIGKGDKRRQLKKKLPEICPKVCDPFKNRANQLFEQIDLLSENYSEEEINAHINELIERVK